MNQPDTSSWGLPTLGGVEISPFSVSIDGLGDIAHFLFSTKSQFRLTLASYCEGFRSGTDCLLGAKWRLYSLVYSIGIILLYQVRK